jgi:hypothetical protein
MNINNKFKLQQCVFLITDSEQLTRIITAIQISNDNSLLYRLACGTNDSWHFEFEIAESKNYSF